MLGAALQAGQGAPPLQEGHHVLAMLRSTLEDDECTVRSHAPATLQSTTQAEEEQGALDAVCRLGQDFFVLLAQLL